MFVIVCLWLVFCVCVFLGCAVVFGCCCACCCSVLRGVLIGIWSVVCFWFCCLWHCLCWLLLVCFCSLWVSLLLYLCVVVVLCVCCCCGELLCVVWCSYLETCVGPGWPLCVVFHLSVSFVSARLGICCYLFGLFVCVVCLLVCFEFVLLLLVRN